MTRHPEQHPDQWADEPTTDLERLMATPPSGDQNRGARLLRGRADTDWADALDTSLHYGRVFAASQAGAAFDDEIRRHLDDLVSRDIRTCIWALLDHLALTHNYTALVAAAGQSLDAGTRCGLGYVRLARRIDHALLEDRGAAILSLEVAALREVGQFPRRMWRDLLAAADVLT